ncbi:hypothetical protein B0H15DRAFT_831597 [Mycena belliarum]|uniref:Uncharacterized protein n=1 Tax=Mycena belliarum TaxID=1033014 RepID=A0AAD6U8I5_9AGAR|nr:hypothetical protein B0H15DRAFT_831597 [Mycena belliae]
MSNMCYSPELPSPPAYHPGDRSPTYSSTPRPTERTLRESPRRSRTPPSGVCIKSVGNVTLVLMGQEENTEQPAYRAGAQLTGSILLQHPENTISVVVTIHGLLEMCPLAASYSAIPVVTITNTLYAQRSENSPLCPHSLAFAYDLPSMFRRQRNGEAHPLPPTCHISLDDSPLHYVRCAYGITVTVQSFRHQRFPSFLMKTESVSFDLHYRPHVRPSQPPIPDPSLFATVKRCPEEWAQCGFQVIPMGDSLPVMCDLFTPSVGVFCVAESIPFHLQLSITGGFIHHIHRFFATGRPIRVSILRQIKADTGDRTTKRDIILGEGTLRVLSKGATLNWEGEARCRDPSSVVGSFDCGQTVVVADMLTVEITPPAGCPLRHTTFGHPIKLTTHRWDEAS